jgi:predicted DNA-binding ribbon-helix-helix protein
MPPAKARHGKSVLKRSVYLDGHKTSVTLEDAFWDTFKEIAAAQGSSTGLLIGKIDSERLIRHHKSFVWNPSVRARLLSQVRLHLSNKRPAERRAELEHGKFTAPRLITAASLVYHQPFPPARFFSRLLEAYHGKTLCLRVRSIGEGAALRVSPHGVGFVKVDGELRKKFPFKEALPMWSQTLLLGVLVRVTCIFQRGTFIRVDLPIPVRL